MLKQSGQTGIGLKRPGLELFSVSSAKYLGVTILDDLIQSSQKVQDCQTKPANFHIVLQKL